MKVPYKYLYIDDIKADDTENSIDTPLSLARGLSRDDIEVEYMHVFEFVKDNFIINNLSNYDGLLLDLRLDEYKDDKTGQHTEFTATEFAQHIRTLVTKKDEGLYKDLPIILFSTDDKLEKVYSTDLSSHNLFDRYLTKVKTPDDASKKLYALAKGYIEIEKSKTSLSKIMGIDNILDLDSRIFSRFSENPETIPTHEYAQVILKDLIYVPGPLINEDILAARLGVDKSESDDWNEIIKIFENARYEGVFSDGWNRWWMYEIDNIFEEIFDTYLSHSNAEEKVQLFIDKFNLKNLIFSKPIQLNSSTRYTTVCKAFNKPMDEMEGFRVYSVKEPKQWQEYEYASLEAFATTKVDEKKIKVHIDDRESLLDALSNL